MTPFVLPFAGGCQLKCSVVESSAVTCISSGAADGTVRCEEIVDQVFANRLLCTIKVSFLHSLFDEDTKYDYYNYLFVVFVRLLLLHMAQLQLSQLPQYSYSL